jgi:hypothetical protein
MGDFLVNAAALSAILVIVLIAGFLAPVVWGLALIWFIAAALTD